MLHMYICNLTSYRYSVQFRWLIDLRNNQIRTAIAPLPSLMRSFIRRPSPSTSRTCKTI
ncbi:hypothetical protein Hanom_Chr16g01520561 [Helianthus anomalus]